MILEIFLLVCIASIWLFFGFQILKYLIPQIGKIAALSLGAILGEVLYLFFVNILSYIIEVKFSSIIILIIMLIGGLMLFNCNKYKQKLNLEIDKPHFIFLIIISALICGVYFINLFFGADIIYDYEAHYPMAMTVAEDNFPPPLINNPDYAAQYHYGIDLLAGSLISITDTKPWNAFNVLLLWNLIWTFFATFILGRLLSAGNFASGFWAAFILLFSNSYAYLEDVFNLGYIRMGSLHSQIATSHALHVFHIPSSLSMPNMLIIFCIIYFIINSNKLTKSSLFLLTIISAICIGTLSLSSEDGYVLISASLFLVAIYYILKKRNNIIKTYPYKFIIIAIIVGGIIASIEGGVITDALINKNNDMILEKDLVKFQIKSDPGIVYWGEDGFMPLSNPYWPLFILIHLGPILFLLPFIMPIISKHLKEDGELFIIYSMLFLAIASLLIPTFITYPLSDINFSRIYYGFKNFGNIIFGIAFGIILLKNKKKIFQQMIIISLLILIFLSSFGPLFFNFNLFFIQKHISSWGWRALPANYIDHNDIKIFNDIKQITPKNSRFLTNNFTALSTMTGRLVPYAKDRYDVYRYHPAFINLFPKPSLENLRLLKISYIYIPAIIKDNNHGFEPDFLKIKIDQNYLQSHTELFALVREWEFNSAKYYLYKVL